MSFYVKAKNFEKAKEMLEKLLEMYEKDIEAYRMDEEIYDLRSIPDHLKIEIRSASRHGGSLSITLPASFSKEMGIKPGDVVALILDKKLNEIYIKKVLSIKTG